MPVVDSESLNGTDSNVFVAEINVFNGHISSLVFTCASDGKKITLCPCAEAVISGGTSIHSYPWTGSVRIGMNVTSESWPFTK